ncbi:hypothetical protein GGR54DRAFT_138199 [Hypoxylon sp. NC1633]|nr:hypothetical protein GGR54DRAFT_138199 [Hypoxylon sp. NC1633]
MTTAPLYARILAIPAARQDESPLFRDLPAEVRTSIFSLALTDYPDPTPDNQYAAETCYTRPHYFAPRRTDTALLRTCRAAYEECWFLPFMLQEQAHWLTAQNRAPPEYRVHMSQASLQSRLQQIKEQRGGDEELEIEGLRVFAQMYILEEGRLTTLLGTPGLCPRRLTLTIRHADWWNWETDQPLRFEASWIEAVCKVLPSSVREVCIELESLERKQDQVDSIAKQMRERWFFKRTDDVALFPDVTGGNVEVSRWSGTSTWHNQRWIRDETAPGRIGYYVVCVPFRLQHAVERQGGGVSDEAIRAASANVFDTRRMRLYTTRRATRTVAGTAASIPVPQA